MAMGRVFPVISANGMVFNVSNTLARQGGRMLMDPYEHRPTGRGGPNDIDILLRAARLRNRT
jgi:hypothetical protein